VKSDLLSAKRGSHENFLWVQIFRKENRRVSLEFFGPVKGKISCWRGPSDPWVEEGSVISFGIRAQKGSFLFVAEKKRRFTMSARRRDRQTPDQLEDREMSRRRGRQMTDPSMEK
jgi:hypothetical protein